MPDIPSRIVPGAPPPSAPAKAQKKKRKAGKKEGEEDPQTPATGTVEIPDAHSAALTDKAPGAEDVQAGSVADELLTHGKEPSSEPKSSPVVDLLNKRVKALTKKITRIYTYSDKPTSELNEDQKKTLATLPSLEAVRKELEEAKKAVEALEAEQAVEKVRQKAEAEEAERRRIAEAVAAAEASHIEQTLRVLDLLRLRSILVGEEEPETIAPTLAPPEIAAIRLAGNVLLAQEPEYPAPRHNVLTDLLRGEGEISATPHSRLHEIVNSYFNAQVEEEIEEAIEEAVAEAEAEAAAEIVQELAEELAEELALEGQDPAISGLPPTAGAPMGLAMNFLQESELEKPVSFEDGAEWVEKEPEEEPTVTRQVVVEEDSTGAVTITETTEVHVHTSDQDPLSWADDEGGLPPIAGLHASFGTPDAAPPAPEVHHEQPNGHVHAQQPEEDDGFQQARSGRARARPRGQYHGGERGSFRGGDRGGYRGGERGGHRGGEHGGSFRGGRGGRGRPHQDLESGNWRGGDGDRGRGRGRGRGGFDRARGDRGTRGGRGGYNGNAE